VLLKDLKVQIYSDGAKAEDLRKLSQDPLIKGFTTNPSLMRKAGVVDYEGFVREALSIVKDKPISFEVFADDFDGMKRQALKLAAMGDSIFVKIPITNTQGTSTLPLVSELSKEGVKLNITAILTLDQVTALAGVLSPKTAALVSVFAGRIADTGVDPVPLLKNAKKEIEHLKKAALLWASTREIFNIFEAEKAGCDIITVPPEFLAKLGLIGRDLGGYSLDTVRMFYRDATASAYQL